MANEPRYLITTADERTWKMDHPITFLGEWCRKYNRKHIWEQLDAVVAPPYGVTHEQKYADKIEVDKLFETLFPHFVSILNTHHEYSYSKRAWSIILGNWFEMHLRVLLNRIKTIKQCIPRDDLYTLVTFKKSNDIKVAGNSTEANDLYRDDEWNRLIYEKIIRELWPDSFLFENINTPEAKIFQDPSREVEQKSAKYFLKQYYKKAMKSVEKYGHNNRIFLIFTILPKYDEIMLNIKHNQWPIIWGDVPFPNLMLRRYPG